MGLEADCSSARTLQYALGSCYSQEPLESLVKWNLNLSEIKISQGSTASERYLAKLGRFSFLSLWCYPNLYTNEGKKNEKSDGKELCDMLVVFEDQIIIFSDKDISFKNTGNLQTDWARWVRRAVLESAPQIYGAENFIKNFPDRIFLDRKCTQKFPISLDNSESFTFHRIIVARNAVQRFRDYAGGSGSLIIRPDIIGKEVENHPFQIGIIDKNKGFIHIFDDLALDVIMRELDTISDLTRYLTDKQQFIEQGNLAFAAGEEDLLGYYLSNSSKTCQPHFANEENANVAVAEGFYEYVKSLPQYNLGKNEDKNSYFIDHVIEHFAKHAFDSSWHYCNTQSFEEAITGLKTLASENRLGRRMIGKAIKQKIQSLKPNTKGVRVIASPTNDHVLYVWLILPIPSYAKNYEDYREVRNTVLSIYCRSAKLLMPERSIIVGIATDPPGEGGSEDMLYLDTTDWTEKDFDEARRDREQFGFLKSENVVFQDGTEYQFPDPPQKRNKVKQGVNPNSKRKSTREMQKKSRKKNR